MDLTPSPVVHSRPSLAVDHPRPRVQTQAQAHRFQAQARPAQAPHLQLLTALQAPPLPLVRRPLHRLLLPP